VSPAKTAEPIEMPFGVVTRGGGMEPCMRYDADAPSKGAILGCSALLKTIVILGAQQRLKAYVTLRCLGSIQILFLRR